MAEVVNNEKAGMKKENRFVKFLTNHKEAIITGVTCLSAGAAIGYIFCKASHYESNNTIDDCIETFVDNDVANSLIDKVPTPEVDTLQDPEVIVTEF